MVAYEFCTSRVSKEPNLIGILPERRKHSTRITAGVNYELGKNGCR